MYQNAHRKAYYNSHRASTLLQNYVNVTATGTGQLLTNIALEDKLTRLLDAGNQAMRLSRSEFWATLDDFPPPQR